MILFKTSRLIVRYFTEKDKAAFFSVAGSEEVMHYIRPAKSREASDQFLMDNIRMYQQGSCIGRFAVFEKTSHNFIGTFSYLYLCGDADFHIGYALVKEVWGKGYATELVKAGIPFFFAHTQYPHLWAITDPENIPSQKVLQKNGFQAEEPRLEDGKMVNVFRILKPDQKAKE
jgi:RimJ/RimL family protein N-acetyltransferase